MFERYLKKGVTKTADDSGNGSPAGEPPLIARMTATGLGAGYSPLAQGTVGSLWIPAFYVLYVAAGRPAENMAGMAIVVLAAVSYFAGVWAASVCEPFWGKDPGRVVIDEISGMFVSLMFLPLTALTVTLAFVFFRIFDILKPPPVKQLESCRSGWGVMNDDVMAGVYANIAIRIVLFFVTGS